MDIKKAIEKYDKSHVYDSVVELSKQVEHAWEDANKVEIPQSYHDTQNIVMCGMGGSGLGARVIESLYFDTLKNPISRVNDYNLPNYVDEKSLIFVSSYSGNTEETVNNLEQAIEKNAKIVVIGAGGKLIDIAKNKNLPFYQIDPKHNPSNQPRMAIGYSLVGQLVLADKAGVINLHKEEIDEAVRVMNLLVDENSVDSKKSNPALQTAEDIKNKIVLIVSAEHLVGASHVANNQFNENSKNLTADYFIPELNHHLMEGLAHPKSNKDNVAVFFIKSSGYPERINKRFEITKNVVEKNGIKIVEFKTTSKQKFSQVFETIQFGAFVNFYLSMNYEIDPSPIPWVDYFKNQLGQPLGK